MISLDCSTAVHTCDDSGQLNHVLNYPGFSPVRFFRIVQIPTHGWSVTGIAGAIDRITGVVPFTV